MSEEHLPATGFHFSVTVLGSGSIFALLTDVDASFQEVSGVQAEFQVEEVVEGGENRFVHRLPRPARYSNLVLKRGVVTTDSFIAEWFGQSVGSGLSIPLLPQNILLLLLNESGMPMTAWAFVNAWPIKWDVGPFDAMANRVLIESLELSYNYFERVNLGSPVSAALKLAQLASRLA